MRTATDRSPRTYRIVGERVRVDERDTPHPRAQRGELGKRIQTYLKTRAGVDAFTRMFGAGGDPNNSLLHLLTQIPEGAVNTDRAPQSDPADTASKIKEVARFLGADVVGFTHLDQAYVYSHRQRARPDDGYAAGDPIDLPHRYAICLGVASDYKRYMTNNSRISDAEYALGNMCISEVTYMLACYIRELGYPARAHHTGRSEVNPMALAVNAGLGELGRHGLLIHADYGSRLHLGVVTTDLELTVDQPVDIAVEEFCKYCMKCARTCPSNSITFGGKQVVNGVEKYAINVDTCYKFRLAGKDNWACCTICVSSCCYNKPKAWWHTLATQSVMWTPKKLRVLLIKPLLWIDDLFWGKRPWLQMSWVDYDNTPAPATCDIPGCTADHSDVQFKKLHHSTKRWWRLRKSAR